MFFTFLISFVCTVLNLVLNLKYVIIPCTINFVNLVLFIVFAFLENTMQYRLNKIMILKISMYFFSFVLILNALILLTISVLSFVMKSSNHWNFGLFNICMMLLVVMFWNFVNIVKFMEFQNSQHYILPISTIYKFNN